MPLATHRDFAIVPDADTRLLTPDKGPPRTSGSRPQDGAFFGEGLLPGGVWGGAEFPMDFVLIGMGQQLIEQTVGTFEFENAIGGQQRGQAFLPVIMPAFDFTFGLRGGRIAQRDAIEVQGRAELRKSVRRVGEEKGVEIHMECQWQTVVLEGSG